MLQGLLDFFFPRTCVICERRLAPTERSVCAGCLSALPRIIYKGGDEHGRIERLFWGKVAIERATCGFRYDSDEVRTLVHAFKYHGQPHAAADIGEVLADELSATDFFDGIDVLVPMPLHQKRLRQRGYNQCDYIARGLQRVTGLPIVGEVLFRAVNNPTQTHLTLIEREQNVANIFAIRHPERLAGRHILLIDDVMTTGSTLLSAMQALASIPAIRISTLTIAYAGMVKPELV